MEESLRFFYDMMVVDKTCVPIEEYTALKYDGGTVGMNGLYSGKYAMFVHPEYGCLYLNKSYGDVPEGTDIGLANMPRPVGILEDVTTTYTSQAYLPANVENPDASWVALKYICIDNAEFFAGPKCMHPGYEFKSVEQADAFNKIIFENRPGLDYEMAMNIMRMPRTLVSLDNTINQGQAKINELIFTDMSKVFRGEMGVNEALIDLKVKGDQFIAEDLK
jgi:multiple sugar transport system substrate-binding protein